MPIVNYTDDPTISDTVEFNFTTTDTNGNPVTPYIVSSVTIYFLERSFTAGNAYELDQTVGGQTLSTYYSSANPVAIFGDNDTPAYIAEDTTNAFLTLTGTGQFQLFWTPLLASEGNYFLCYTYTVLPAGDPQTLRIDFYLGGDTQQTTSIPTHFTDPKKYDTLLELYLPEMFKMMISSNDLTPVVLEKFNKIIASGFTGVENLVNQIIDLLDANATHETILPYLARIFNLTLRTQDVTLWRRQIKQAVPLYKQKGTLAGLVAALDESQANFISLTRYWQVTSKYTWQDGFVINDDTSFVLSKYAVLPTDGNFAVFYRAVGTIGYEQLNNNTVIYDNNDGITTAIWQNSFALSNGDVLLLRYTILTPGVNQTVETYVQGLPIADERDETTFPLPPKNWNIRLIADDDLMLPLVCPSLNPFSPPVVYGHVRTEFPFSENIYNMETYNASLRESTEPCDLDKYFLDCCSCCVSNKFSIDVQIENLSDDRISEVEQVVLDYVPFHAQLFTINYIGSISDFIPPPVERIEMLMNTRISENIVLAQGSFTRNITNGIDDSLALKRDMLASSNVVVTESNGIGKNIGIVLYSPAIHFDMMGISSDNLLEILSGSNTGDFSVTVTGQYVVQINGTIGFPLDMSAFPFNLSNLIYSNPSVSVYQDNLFLFTDSTVNFIASGTVSADMGTPWNIVVTTGAHTGTYPIQSMNPNGSLVLSGWAGSTATVAYNLQNGATVIFSSSGTLTVQNRGRVVVPFIQKELGIIQGDYCYFDGGQYVINNFALRSGSHDQFYISSYSGGDVVGIASIDIYRRLIQNSIGYLDVQGMTLTTSSNYESSLGIANGSNPIPNPLENNLFIENFLVLIGSNYYQITGWDGTVITLSGPMLSWGVVGTLNINYSIIQFIKTSPIYTEDGTEFNFLDRRNDGIVTLVDSPMSLAMRAGVLNASNENRPFSSISTRERIWIQVETKNE